MQDLDLFQKIVSRRPGATYFDVLKEASHLGLVMDTSSIPQSVLDAPAWRVLYQVRLSKTIAERREARNNTIRRQFLETGKAVVIEGLLCDSQTANLRNECESHFRKKGLPPLVIAREQVISCVISNPVFLNSASALLLRYKKQSMKPTNLAVIENRCMLRRTYCTRPNRYSNANNQLWHQDSNEIFRDRPMLTFWVPLQEGCGSDKPSLEFLNLANIPFNHILGNNSSKMDLVKHYQPKNLSTFIIDNVRAGDAVVFNGLTFHQTYTRPNMTQSRDALVIRICDPDDEEHFPGITSDPVILRLGS